MKKKENVNKKAVALRLLIRLELTTVHACRTHALALEKEVNPSCLIKKKKKPNCPIFETITKRYKKKTH